MLFFLRDVDHPGEDLGAMYAGEVSSVLDAVLSEGKRPACFIAESFQSCGGQIVYPEGFLSKAYAAVRSRGGICVADEVQVGFGRVGSHWWAFQVSYCFHYLINNH